MEPTHPVHLCQHAAHLANSWRSDIVARLGHSQIKVLRMDAMPLAEEVHPYDEAFLVLEGQLQLKVAGQDLCVREGELQLVPAGVSHAVTAGSHGTLLIIDPPRPPPC